MCATLAWYLITRRNDSDYETNVREYYNSRTMEINQNGGNTMLEERNMTSWTIATELIKGGSHIQHKEQHERNRTDGFFNRGFGPMNYHENLVKHGSIFQPTHDMQNA